MKQIFMAGLVFFSTALFAAESDGTVYVDVDSNVYDIKDFPAKKGAKVQALKKEVPKPQIPVKAERDALYKKVSGLDKHLESMDQFDKDMLFIHAKTNETKELEKLYPDIPSKTLASLKAQIRKIKSK